MGGALRRRSRSWPHGHPRCRGGVAGDMRRECREGRQKRNLRSPPTSSVPRCIPPWRCATPRIEAPGHGPRQGGRWYAAVGRREDSVGWGRGILSQKNWGIVVLLRKCDGASVWRRAERWRGVCACDGQRRGEDAGGEWEGGRWSGRGGLGWNRRIDSARGGGVKKKGNGRGGLVEGSAWPAPRWGGGGGGRHGTRGPRLGDQDLAARGGGTRRGSRGQRR